MHPSRSRLVVATILGVLLASSFAAPGTAAGPSPSPAASTGPIASPDPVVAEHWTWCDDPGPAHAAYCESLDPDLDDAGWCALLGAPEASCYHTGSARIVLRGGARRTLEVPMRIGERLDPDLGDELWLQYGGHGDAYLTLGVPAAPGATTTTTDGGAPGMDWAISGVGSGSAAGCAMTMSMDALGVVTGTVRCPDVRTRSRERLRLTVTFRAVPLVAGPPASPEPSVTPRPSANPDPVCGLLDGARVEAATGAAPGTLLLLPAGPGQCVGFAADIEQVALIFVEGSAASPLGAGTTWRGAACEPLLLTVPDLAPTAAACAWPDGRRFVVAAAVADGATSLVLSLALPASLEAEDPTPQTAIDALVDLVREVLARRS